MKFQFFTSDGALVSVDTVAEIDSIGDVVITSVADDEVLAYDSGGNWINQTAAEAGLATDDHTHAVDDLSDTTIDTPADNEVLAYDDGTSEWINQTPEEAGLIPGTLTDLGDGEVLVSSSGDFVNNTLAEAGIAADDHNHGTNGVVTKVATTDTANPPTDAELDTAFGEPATVGSGFVGILDDAGGGAFVYICASDGTNWWYAAMTKAV